MSDFEALYRQYWFDVYRFSLYLCGNAHDAEDLTEEAFLRAWMSTKPVRVATVKAYLFMIVRNLHIDQMRRARPGEAPDEALPDSRPGPADAAGGRHELGPLAARVHRLLRARGGVLDLVGDRSLARAPVGPVTQGGRSPSVSDHPRLLSQPGQAP